MSRSKPRPTKRRTVLGAPRCQGAWAFGLRLGVWGAAGCAPTLCDRAVLRLEAEAGLEFDDAAGEGAEALAEG